MRLEDAGQPHASPRSLVQVLLDRVGRVDDHGGALMFVADDV